MVANNACNDCQWSGYLGLRHVGQSGRQRADLTSCRASGTTRTSGDSGSSVHAHRDSLRSRVSGQKSCLKPVSPHCEVLIWNTPSLMKWMLQHVTCKAVCVEAHLQKQMDAGGNVAAGRSGRAQLRISRDM